MFNKRSLFVTAALFSFGLLGMSAAQADDTHCYTNASIRGIVRNHCHLQRERRAGVGCKEFRWCRQRQRHLYTQRARGRIPNRCQDDHHRDAEGNLHGELRRDRHDYPNPHVIDWRRNDSDG